MINVLHESATTDLDVQNQGVGSLGDLLRHDRRSNEGNTIHGRGDVTQRVELLICRSQTCSSRTNHGSAAFTQLVVDLVIGQRRTPAGDGLEFVKGSTRVAEASAGKLRHCNAEDCNKRGKRKGDLIAHATGRVLIRGYARNTRKIHALARIDHGLSPRHDFFTVHSAQENSHGQGGHLLVLHDPARVGINGPLNFFSGQFPAIALHANDVDGIKLFHDVLPGCYFGECLAGAHTIKGRARPPQSLIFVESCRWHFGQVVGAKSSR